MHFLDLYRKLFFLVVVTLGFFSELASAIPVDVPGVVEASTIEAPESTHLASRKSTRGGWATYYDTEEGRGACGKYNHNREHVVAIGKPLWDSTQGKFQSDNPSEVGS
ncbi:hypothetical protein B0J17DRAFT_625194 [Rhizoctonia solani]|nr:hypothetical protein B0J17DRAFT_625194 [Rhizoctonia solani]